MASKRHNIFKGKVEEQDSQTGMQNFKPTLLVIAPKKVTTRLFYIAALLFLINLLIIYFVAIIKVDGLIPNALIHFFDARLEGNVPTLFNTLLLLLASILLYVIYRASNPIRHHIDRRYWFALGTVFLFLTIDEATSVHEQFNKTRDLLSNDLGGYLSYPWIITYLVFSVLAFLFFKKFIYKLPSRTRRLFLISGFIYVSAAILFEPFEGRVSKLYGVGHLYDRLMCAIEEFLEMTAVILFIYAILDYARNVKLTFLVHDQKQEDQFGQQVEILIRDASN